MAAGNLDKALKLLKNFIEDTDFVNQPIETENLRRYDISAYETETFDDSKIKFNNETRPERDHISILGDNVKRYLDCVNAIYNAVDPQLIDRKTVEEYIEQVVIKSVDPAHRYNHIGFRERLTKSIAKLAAQLRAEPTDSEVYLQVDGLSHQGLPMTFGKFKFDAPSEAMRRRIIRSANRVMRISSDTHATKTKFMERLNGQYLEIWNKKSIAITTVKSVTHEAARSQAVRELRDTLDVINFFADFLYTTGNGGCVSMPEEWGNGRSLSLIIGKDSAHEPNRLNVQLGLEGRISALKFDKDDIRQLNKYGFKRASDILRKTPEERTPRETKIFNAIRWAGRATFASISNERFEETTDAGREITFLFYAVSLESLLLKKGSDIGYRFSTWGAHLIAKPSRRLEVKNRLNELYSVRSNIAHNGATSVFSEDLIDMREFAKSAIIRVLTDAEFVKMSKEKKENKNDREREGFDVWFETQLLK